MPTFRAQFLALMRQQEADLQDALADRAESIRRLLLAAADSDGNIPVSRWRALEDQVAALLLTYFVDVDANRVPTAFTVNRDGDLRPQSPYMRLLWANIQTAARLAVQQQAALLRRSLQGASDIRFTLNNATISPFLALHLLEEEAARMFRAYVPPSRREIGGRVLSDRVLNAGFETSRKARLLTRHLLAAGKSAREVAETVERWLTGKLADGSTGRFDAARLLRGETTYAYGSVGALTSTLNPFVDGIDWVLHPSHNETDACDLAATGSPYVASTLPPYPGHSNCLCHLRFHVHKRTVTTIETLRGTPERLRVRGSLSPGFVDLLLREGNVGV